MGRLGITLEDVEIAVSELQGKGKSITVDHIREILGTGSKSTIIQHLKKIKPRESISILPPELISLVTGLWERINQLTDQRINEIQTENQAVIRDLTQSVEKASHDHHELITKLHDVEKKLFEESNIRETTDKQLSKTERELEQIEQRLSISTQIIEEQKAENQRLHQLASHIQANLEHYQQAIQQARTEQLLQLESQQHKFQCELLELRKEIQTKQEELEFTKKAFYEQEIQFQQEKQQRELLQAQNNQYVEMQLNDKRELYVLQDRYEQYKLQCDTYKKSLEDKSDAYSELQNIFKLNLYKLEQTTNELDKFTRINSQLLTEKMDLIKENAALLEKIKQTKEAPQTKKARELA